MNRPRNWTFDNEIEFSLNTIRINEERHIFRSCQFAIDDIANHIFNDVKNRTMKSFESGWYYISQYNNAVLKKDLSDNLTSYPICIEYERTSGLFDMCVESRFDSPDKAKIIVNIFSVSNVVMNFIMNNQDEEAYRWLHRKVSHEFGHIRQNYGLKWITDKKNNALKLISIENNRRLVSMEFERVFDFNNKKDELEEFYNNIIPTYLYLFSPSEIDQRIRETYDYVDMYSKDELNLIQTSENLNSRHEFCSFMLRESEDAHQTSYMLDIIDYIKNMKPSLVKFRQVLLIAFYFKFYNRYKTSDPINKNFIETLWNSSDDYVLSPKEISTYESYCYHFVYYLESVLKNMRKKLFKVVYDCIYQKIWESIDIYMFSKSMLFESTGCPSIDLLKNTTSIF